MTALIELVTSARKFPVVTPPPASSVVATSPPQFSVVIAAYQAAGTIVEAVQSVLDQTIPALEIVICDDGSTDDLERALLPVHEHVTLIRLPVNSGEAAAKNEAIRAARGEYVAILDSDDVFLPERLEAFAQLAAARPDLDILCTDAFVVGPDGRVISRIHNDADLEFPIENQRGEILRRNFVIGPVALRRSRFLAIGAFDEDIRHATDWDCWIRMILSDSRVGLVDEPLAHYRLSPTSLSTNRKAMADSTLVILHNAALTPGLGDDERSDVDQAIVVAQCCCAREALRAALTDGSRDVRRLASRIITNAEQPTRSRLLAVAVWLAPQLAGRDFRRRAASTWRTIGNREFSASPEDLIDIEAEGSAGPNDLSAADLRFTLPRRAAHVAVLGGLGDWRRALKAAGVRLASDVADTGVDLVVAPRQLAHEALSTNAPAVLIEGRVPKRKLRAAGYHAEHLVVLRPQSDSRTVVSLDARRALRFLLVKLALPISWKIRLQNHLAAALLGRPVRPPERRTITRGLREQGAPFPLALAARWGLPVDAEWFLDIRSQERSHLPRAFFGFEGRDIEPSWVLKFGRVPTDAEHVDRYARGVRLANEAGSSVADHAPRLLGHDECDGLPMSLETFARGPRLHEILRSKLPYDAKLHLVEVVARWIVDLGETTATPPCSLQTERLRLDAEILEPWLTFGAPRDLVLAMPDVPGVLLHGDASPVNIRIADGDFTVIDWEDCRLPGLPLWDLASFLRDALGVLGAPEESWSVASHALVKGELEHLEDAVYVAATSFGVACDPSRCSWVDHHLGLDGTALAPRSRVHRHLARR